MAFFRRANPLLGYWKEMCAKPTPAEASLEPHIAKLGQRYRHQYPFWGLKYFADFALIDQKLIIEVDGDSHDRPAQKEKDLLHEAAVLELGWRVYRCSNEQALKSPAAAVAAALEWLACKAPDKALQAETLTARLAQLHKDYPSLLAARAKQSKSKSQASIKAARTRRRRSKLGLYKADSA